MSSKPEEIDELLDQVEKNYNLKSTEAIKLSQINPGIPDKLPCPCTLKEPTNWEEVDEMLKDFKFEDSNPFGKSQNKSWARKEIVRCSDDKDSINNTTKKCYPIYLSGSFESMGYSTLGAEKPCDKLKCLRCDFPVVIFDNYVWHESTDYLFLRNNIPDFDKLKLKLIRRKGYRAYACQCQSLSILKITNVMSQPQIRWVCGKHS